MTDSEKLTAKTIVDQWFWQPDSWHRKSVVRFYESAPLQPDVLKLVIAYLKQDETDRLFILNKELQLDEVWKATDAWFQTSPSDKWAGTESSKVRIYQSFKPKADENDGPYTVENGCKYLVTHEFHWEVEEIPSLPASSSGIQYTLQGVSRDKDTGLFSCVVEKRETVQQDVSEYGTAESAFESRSEELHLGVRQSSVGSTGKRASVGNGRIVRRKVTKNPDCTCDVQNETIDEKSVKGAVVEYRRTLRGTVKINTDRCQASPVNGNNLSVGETRRSEKTEGNLWNNTVQKADESDVGEVSNACEQTIFEHTDTKVDVVAKKPGPAEAQPPKNGKTHRRSVRLTEDNSFEVEDLVRQEQKVVDSVVSVRKTRRAKVITKTDRGMPTPPDFDNLEVGEEVRSERTPGDLYNNTKEQVLATPAGVVSVECSKDAFSERDTKSQNVKDIPEDEHVDPPADGVTHSRSFRVTEEQTVDVTDVTLKEIPVENAEVVIERTLHGLRTTKKSRNQPNSLGSAGMKIGEVRKSELTPGKLFNQESSSFEPVPFGTVAKSCQKNIFEETDEVRTNQDTMPGDHVGSAGRGRTLRRIAQKNEDNTVDVTETETNSIPRSWQAPEVNTNYLYRRQWLFRNFTKSQVKTLCEQASKFFDAKVCGWVNDHRPPSSQDVTPQVQLRENGRYDGQVTCEARWGLTTAGQNGSKECLYYMLKFSYYSFDPWGSRNFSSGIGPRSISEWNGTWHGAKYTAIRAAGRGKSVLDKIAGNIAIVRAPQVSFNPSTEEWELDAIMSVAPYGTISSVRSSIESDLKGLGARMAPDVSDGSEPDISYTEYGE